MKEGYRFIPDAAIDAKKEAGKLKERTILDNRAFNRFAGCLELYQQLLVSNDSKRDEISKRMRELYLARLARTSEQPDDDIRTTLHDLLDTTLGECETDNFSSNTLAKRIAQSPLADIFLYQWNAEAGKVETGSGMVFMNELIAYKEEDGSTISLHIRPTGVASEDVVQKTLEGFVALAQKLQNEEIHAETITMKSWLLSKRGEAKAKMLLGEDIEIRDIDQNDDSVEAIQQMALQYNKKSLEDYLVNGNKPEVRQVSMTKIDFVKRLLG
jgi:hypothetical protein